MKENSATAFLTKGLIEGYLGTAPDKVKRFGFEFSSTSLFDVPSDSRYRDEWIGKKLGGGQEVVKVNSDFFTRLYAGGTIDSEKLAKLDIDEKDVLVKLKSFILEAKENTRLFSLHEAQNKEWSYRYEIKDKLEDPSLTVAMETISYENNIVFVHYILLSPII